MGYAILRTQKLKDKGSIRRSLKHSFRAQDTPNADPEKTPDNTHIFADNVDSAMDNITARLNTQAKIRKNAVLAIEYLVTGSPEVIHEKTREEQDQYFHDAIEWLRDKHGKENVVYAGVHRDEQTPHLYAYVVPIDERGKLNCREFLGGAKKLNEMQTEFANQVGNKHGLQRGIEGSKAKHQKVSQFYTNINKEIPEIVNLPKEKKVIKKNFLTTAYESDHDLAKRVANMTLEALASELEKSKITKQALLDKQQYQLTAEKLQNEAKQYRDLMKGLTPEQQTNIKRSIEQLKQDNEAVLKQSKQPSRGKKGKPIDR